MKQQMRQQIRRGGAPPLGASVAIQQRLMAQDWWGLGFQVGLYRATTGEPATDALLADLLARHARVAVPRRRGGNYAWNWVDENTRWRTGAHGIPEPCDSRVARPADLRIVVVPGLAFDSQGGRLGHGRGHFDRLLAASGALRVGLCFECRLVEAVPMEAHDVRMDVVVTEARLLFASTAAAKMEWLTVGNEGS
ncbi:MAG: 5-formyltetrahydrofolate cyclo-ligase [Kiritimatiellae bacterium]|jgi:5-formyltetrahydrofolate cyclo-ligase|nr:5-formyltetrahydrofolate cyclo-ligase [Kiritimatiellia bacterium]NLD89924.1 5-formyltetrahydrofolate cyclo-ligase [Lentisphaerota bacterium]HPC18676.1 5-formyltetrahydrofolate cyclo-ligase [Kiritimatiellia bacterium]HQN80176.1 5-formyltetrahydrofolate cyclo-ligase [Kiritimatiellia bacterium]